MTSYNPFSWAMNAVSSPAASTSKKRKVDDTDAVAGGVTLESIMGEINELKASNKRIERLLKRLVDEKYEAEEKEDSNETESDEEEDDDEEFEEFLNPSWVEQYKQLKKFKAKHGHCQLSRSKTGRHPQLGRWVVRQRSEKKMGKMTFEDTKVEKLNKLGFDWGPQLQVTPMKKRRK